MGLETADQVRHETLWHAAIHDETPLHADACPYCADLLASFRQIRNTLAAENGPVVYAKCPGAETLASYEYGELKGEAADAVAEHLKSCPECKKDLAFLARSQEPREKVIPIRRRLAFMAVAAAAFIACIVPWPWLKDKTPKIDASFTPSAKWVAMAEMPAIDVPRLMKYSPESHHSRLEVALTAYEKGEYKKAEDVSLIIANAVDDPSAEFLLAMSRYKQGKLKEGYAAMKQAEHMRPAPYICWATLNYALLVGDRATIQREASHAGGHAEYADKCHEILAKL